MAAMGVIKALQPKKQWGQVLHADRYFRGELDTQIEEGRVKTQQNLYDALGCSRDHFTETLRIMMNSHREKKVKAYEYVQSFSPKDREAGLTPELAHRLGMEFAEKFFADCPCLVVTHIDTAHLHNQFLIGNIHAQTGKCLQLNAKSLAAMKRFTGEQCLAHGLTESLFAEETKVRKNKKKTDGEHLMESHGKETGKEELLRWIRETIKAAGVENMNDFVGRLETDHEVTVRISGNTISFKHPELSRAVRGSKLADDLDVKTISDEIHREFVKRYRDTYLWIDDGEPDWLPPEQQLEYAGSVTYSVLPADWSYVSGQEEPDPEEELTRLIDEREKLQTIRKEKLSLLDLCRRKIEFLVFNLREWIREKQDLEKEILEYENRHAFGRTVERDKEYGGKSL